MAHPEHIVSLALVLRVPRVYPTCPPGEKFGGTTTGTMRYKQEYTRACRSGILKFSPDIPCKSMVRWYIMWQTVGKSGGKWGKLAEMLSAPCVSGTCFLENRHDERCCQHDTAWS
jgi:hypothetical protein